MIDGLPPNCASTLGPPPAVGQGPVDPDVAPIEDPVFTDMGPRQGLSGELAAKKPMAMLRPVRSSRSSPS
eukprot:12571835-Alexandrium_andersonii.AAC.1